MNESYYLYCSSRLVYWGTTAPWLVGIKEGTKTRDDEYSCLVKFLKKHMLII